jgi:hypothetical protein
VEAFVGLTPSLAGYHEQFRQTAAERIAKGRLLPPALANYSDAQMEQSPPLAVLSELPRLLTYQLIPGRRLDLILPEPKGSLLDLWV